MHTTLLDLSAACQSCYVCALICLSLDSESWHRNSGIPSDKRLWIEKVWCWCVIFTCGINAVNFLPSFWCCWFGNRNSIIWPPMPVICWCFFNNAPWSTSTWVIWESFNFVVIILVLEKHYYDPWSLLLRLLYEPRGRWNTSGHWCVCVVCRYSALSSGVALDMSESRNRSLGRSAGAAAGASLSSAVASAASVREYRGRLSGPSSRSSLTPKSSQEKNFDSAAVDKYVHVCVCSALPSGCLDTDIFPQKPPAHFSGSC